MAKTEEGINILPEEEATELVIEVEKVIEAIKNGKIEGEYLEF